MATFDASDLFTQYYNLYRAEAVTPTASDTTPDDEYTIFLRLTKEAINRWANYDGVYWKELFTTLQTNSTGAVTTITTGTTSYAAPTAMREAGGFVRVNNASGTAVQYYPIIDAQEGQFKDDQSTYCYFTGDPSNGFTLHLNPAPPSSLNGLSMNYVYYKNPTYLTSISSKTEMANPMFIVHRALANRYRASRNPYYEDALRDAENIMGQMKMDNDSGSWANPWKLADNSGSVWGQDSGNSNFLNP